MQRTILFQLKDFNQIPASLRSDPSKNLPGPAFSVNLSRLFHHYYLDGYGVTPPEPDYANFEYAKFLTNGPDFRFLHSGPGTSTQKRRTISQELGQAFTRLFLHDFCGVSYFAHMDSVLEKTMHPAFPNVRVARVAKGDAPDYFCARSSSRYFIAEAKGQLDSIGFHTKLFDQWREQLKRVEVRDSQNRPLATKTFVVGTRFATEDQPRLNSQLFAEDPETNGRQPNDLESAALFRLSLCQHYSRVLSRLGLGLLASSLSQGFSMPAELTYNLPVWRCLVPPFQDELFVGGYFSTTRVQFREQNGLHFYSPNILEITEPTPFFLGIEKRTFRTVFNACRGNWLSLNEIAPAEGIDLGISDFAWSNDKVTSGSLQYFAFIGVESFP